MKRSVVETVLGAVVLIIALVFLAFSYKTANVGSTSGYKITTHFANIGGLKIGDEVQVSGVRVGVVDRIELDPVKYLARVTLDVDNSIDLPLDTVALISSQSLLGGRYLSLEPGADEGMIPKDGKGIIEYTQDPQNLEQLLGKFIFSMSDKEKAEASSEAEPAAQPASP